MPSDKLVRDNPLHFEHLSAQVRTDRVKSVAPQRPTCMLPRVGLSFIVFACIVRLHGSYLALLMVFSHRAVLEYLKVASYLFTLPCLALYKHFPSQLGCGLFFDLFSKACVIINLHGSKFMHLSSYKWPHKMKNPHRSDSLHK